MAGSMLPPLILELRAKASEFNAEMGKARKEVAKTAEEMDKSGKTYNKSGALLSGAGKAVAFGLVGATAAVVAFGVEAYSTAQKADANLNVALRNSGASAEQFDPKIKAADASMRTLGYTNAQTNQALAGLTVALGSPQKALDSLGVAADIARMKNIDLGSASLLVAKAMEGQTRPLRQLGIDLPINTKSAVGLKNAQDALKVATESYKAQLDGYNSKQKHTAQQTEALKAAHDRLLIAQAKVSEAQKAGGMILDELKKRIGGAATAYGDTLPGKISTAKAQLDNLGEKVGAVVVPAMLKAASVAMGLADALMRNKPALIAVAAVVGTVLVGALVAYTANLYLALAASLRTYGTDEAKGLVWVAGKVAQYASAAAAFVAHIAVVAATQVAGWATFIATEVAQGAVWLAAKVAQYATVAASAVVSAATSAAAWVAANIAMIAASAGILLAVAALVAGGLWLYHHWHQVWTDIKHVVSDAFGWVKSHIDLIIEVALGPLGVAIVLLKNHWNAVWTGIKSVVADVWDFLKPIFDAITNGIKAIVGGIGKVAGFIGKIGGGVLKGASQLIPHFAGGTPYAPGGLALVGENGPELVSIPKGSVVHSASQTASMGSTISPSTGGGQPVHVHNVITLDGQVIYRNVIQNAQQYKLRNGQTALT